MKFVIWYLIFSYRDISHLFWPFASMTVCFVRPSSELLQGGPESGRPFCPLRQHAKCTAEPYCALVCYAVFYKLFCMKKDDFLPIFWRCKTIFVTLHHQTKEEVRRRRKRNASLRKRRGKKNRCRKSQRKVPDIDPKGGRWRHET